MRKQRQLEEQQLELALMNGEITHTEYNKEIREMERDERDEARERAEAAYDREMDRL